jgi:hypothetical protein
MKLFKVKACIWFCLGLLILLMLGFSLWFNYWQGEARHHKLITGLCQLINVADALKQDPDKLELINKPDWQSVIYHRIKHDECDEKIVLINGRMVDVFGNSYVLSKEGEKLIVASDLKVERSKVLAENFIVTLN